MTGRLYINQRHAVLKSLSGRSEVIVNRIISQLCKRGKTYEGQLWAKIPAEYFAKSLKLTQRTVFYHIKKLKEEELLISQQFDKDRGDMTNYYTINIDVITSKKFEGFFCPPIVKKLLTSYKGLICPYGAKIKSPTSQNQSGLVGRISAGRKSATSSSKGRESVPTSSPSTTTAQDMHRIWQEETGREDKLNKRLARFMVACLQKVFKTLDRWQEYVKSLCRSTYITENMFSKEYFLKWVLSFKVIQRILDGGFGVRLPEESGANIESELTRKRSHESSSEQKETMKKKSNVIAADVLSDSVMQIYKRYEGDREARELIAKFIEFYGKYEAITVFGNVGIHLRGNRLRLYFSNRFYLDRFMGYGRYNRFIEYCEKMYNFKCEMECNAADCSIDTNDALIKLMKC